MWEDGEIDDVLDDGETGADRKAGDYRIKLVADAVHSEERDHDDRLDRFLDPRRDEPAVERETDRQRVEKRPLTG